MNKPLFIVIEGLDGSGKSTAAKQLSEQLESLFPNKIKHTYEPHNPSCGGEYIRAVLEKRITEFHHRTLALAYAANRLDHCDRIIQPWLSNGKDGIVISDRYYLSSLVYQSRDGLSFESVMQLNELAIQPDLIFFMNVSNETCFNRLENRNQPQEIFDENMEETRRKYFAAIDFLRKTKNEKVIEIDGNGTVEETVEQMLDKIIGKH